MTDDERVRLKAALRIHDHLTRDAGVPPPVPLLPHEAWQELVRSARLSAHAAERGWAAAGAVARAGYRRGAAEVIERLASWQQVLGFHERPRRIQTPREILADLAALEAEFEEVEIDLKEQTVSVTTETVVLEGIELGPFEIALRWDLPADSGAYSVIACEPHPAAEDSSVTHPHVKDEALCEGDAHLPIRRALEEGRLFDFFLLVRQTLTTYGEDSPHVPLSRWDGNPCVDCGRTPRTDESACCDRCQSELCTDCMTPCAECERLCCADCRGRCDGCEEVYCPGCLKACTGCRDEFCRRCLEEGRCESCREPEPNDQSDEDTHAQNDVPKGETSTAEAAPAAQASEKAPGEPAVQPLRVGEAPVPA